MFKQHPTYGYRRLLALLHGGGLHVNRKAVYRVLRIRQWLVHQRIRTPRPRVQSRRSRTTESNCRWAMDVTPIPCGQGGWGT
ncbi:IS3 family transposase [Candidatus Nitrospira neomarina]|uniref:IS3 family transposase n=1 Tax=Candidatus Nitrospira neomarina TaxID=3020899 RepID=UPI0035E3EA7E